MKNNILISKKDYISSFDYSKNKFFINRAVKRLENLKLLS